MLSHFFPPLVKQQEVYKLQGHGLFFVSKAESNNKATLGLRFVLSLRVCFSFIRHSWGTQLQICTSMFQPCWTLDDNVPQEQIPSSAFRSSHMRIKV